MFRQLKNRVNNVFQNRFQYGSYLVISTLASTSKIVSSVGGWLFNMDKAMPRFDGSISAHQANVSYTADTYHLTTMGNSGSDHSSAASVCGVSTCYFNTYSRREEVMRKGASMFFSKGRVSANNDEMARLIPAVKKV